MTKDNWDGGVQIDDEARSNRDACRRSASNEPFTHAPLHDPAGEGGVRDVLANAGATLPKRDPVDERVDRDRCAPARSRRKSRTDIVDELDDVGYTEERDRRTSSS